MMQNLPIITPTCYKCPSPNEECTYTLFNIDHTHEQYTIIIVGYKYHSRKPEAHYNRASYCLCCAYWILQDTAGNPTAGFENKFNDKTRNILKISIKMCIVKIFLNKFENKHTKFGHNDGNTTLCDLHAS